MMPAADRLRQNDPESKHITIHLHNEPSDADLAQALEQNPFITEITVDVYGVQTTNWGDLLRGIATCDNLRTVTLMDAINPEARNAPAAAAALVRSILRAIQQNTSVRTVRLRYLRLSSDISTFVDNASSITSFQLYQCDMDPAGRQHGASDLAMALQRNTNIQTLELGDLDAVYMSSIVSFLLSNISLKTLLLGCRSFSAATTPTIQQLLESTVSIQTFGLGGMRFENDEDTQTLRTIMQSLIQSQNSRTYFERSRKASWIALSSELCHPQLRALADSIPLMHIKALEVVVESDVGGENYKQLLLQAVKNNFSLRFVDGNHHFPPERDLFDAADKTRLVFYADRNKRLDQWVDNSETVGRKVWPEAFKLAENAGPDSLFRGLRSVVLSSEVTT